MSVKQDGERGRSPLTVWKEQSDQINLNTMGLNDSGRLPSSSRIKFSWEERRASEWVTTTRHHSPTGRLDEEDWCGWAERGGCLTWKHPEWQTPRAVELLMRCPYVYLHRADNEITLLCLWGRLRTFIPFWMFHHILAASVKLCSSIRWGLPIWMNQ